MPTSGPSSNPQLAQLWSHEPLAAVKETEEFDSDVGGFTFRSLVQPRYKLTAELEVLMLRPGPPGHLVAASDIDNRLKTLFDGLRAPAAGELPDDWQPDDPTKPTYCLLEDDRFIMRLNVEVVELLRPAPAGSGPNYVELVLGVRVYALAPTWGGQMIL